MEGTTIWRFRVFYMGYSYQAQQEIPQALASMTLSDQHGSHLYTDSGVINHMVNSSGILKNPSQFKGIDLVIIGNDDKLLILSI